MTTQQIKDMVNSVSRFEESIRDRARTLLEIKGVNAGYDEVIWDDCNNDFIWLRVSDRWDSWHESFPIECFSDDFDIEKYKMEIDESAERTKMLQEEKEEKREREEYERLKKKFEC